MARWLFTGTKQYSLSVLNYIGGSELPYHLRREIMSPKYWLMKAEPDSRVVKGKDVKVGHDYCRDDV